MSTNDVNPWNKISSVSAGEPMPSLSSLQGGAGTREHHRRVGGKPMPPAPEPATPSPMPETSAAPTPAAAPNAAPAPEPAPNTAPVTPSPMPAPEPGATPVPEPNAAPEPGATPVPEPNAAPTAPAPEPNAAPTAGPGPMPPFNPADAPAVTKTPVTGGMVAALAVAVISIFFAALPILTLPLAIGALVAVHRIKRTGARHAVLTASQVCAVIGIVFSLFTGILWTFTASLLHAAPNAAESFISKVQPEEEPALTEEEAEVAQVVEAELGRIAGKDIDYLELLDEDLRAVLDAELGITPEDLGLDPNLYPNWMLMDFDYDIDGVFVNDDGTATVFADITVRDPYDLLDRWDERSGDIPDSSNEEQTLRLLHLSLLQAMSEDAELASTYIAVELTYVDDAWAIDGESWDAAVADMLLM